MTGGGDTGEFEEDPIDPDETVNPRDDDADTDAPALDLNLNDAIPSAGGADIGGRAGDDG